MLVNGKFFIPPDGEDRDFKSLFKQAASAGVGRPVDEKGFPLGPWTADLLAEAISQIEANRAGIELRTVQLWFQDNVKGISASNIHWLARIFGCGDPEATSRWQAALSAAQARLVADRRKRSKIQHAAVISDFSDRPTQPSDQSAPEKPNRNTVARLSESMFLGGNPFSAIVLLWGGQALLVFASYIVGTHSVTYSPVEGVSKQVGLFWSPNWILDRLIWLPIMIILVSALIQDWRGEWRSSLLPQQDRSGSKIAWERKLQAHSTAFWAVLLVSLIIVFLVQWYGAYLRPLLQDDVGDRVVDWILVAIERPDVISFSEAVYLSAFANLTSGVAYWFLFAGLLLIYVLACDFGEICREQVGSDNDEAVRHASVIGAKIARGLHDYTVLAVLIATQIKLVAVYLMTDASNIVSWLLEDTYAALGLGTSDWGWFDKTPSASITSFFVLFIPCFVYVICALRIRGALHLLGSHASTVHTRIPWWKYNAVIVMMAVNFGFLGQFTGFSILLWASILLVFLSVFHRGSDHLGQEGAP